MSTSRASTNPENIAIYAERARNLQRARQKKNITQETQSQKYTEQLSKQIQRSRYFQNSDTQNFADKPGGESSDSQKKNNIRLIQKDLHGEIQDDELHQITDDVSDVFTSSKIMLPVKIAQLAVHSRAALKDYTSKWWIVAFAFAIFKDLALDPTIHQIPALGWFVACCFTIGFIIFLFGGGFFRKLGKKMIAKIIFSIIIDMIPFVNILFPGTTIAVLVRWDGSKKDAKKAEQNVKRIREKYAEYDTMNE